MKPRLLLPPLTFAICFAMNPGAQAASNTWAGNAAGNWATAGSWTGGVDIPGSTSLDNADVATFSATLSGSGKTVTVDAARFIGGISFGNTSNFGYTLSGGALNLNNGGIIQTLAANGAHTDTISTAINISGLSAATAFFTANATNASSLLSIGAVTGSATAGNTTTLTLNGSNTGANSITGIIGNGSGTGNLALTKSGTGLWLLSGANTYTGNTTVSAGTLQFSKQVALYNNGAAAAWSKTNINVQSGATMAFNIGGTGEFTEANINTLLSLADSTTNGFNTGSILGLNTSSGSVTFGSVIANSNGGTNVLGLTKLGTNTLTLNQANTYTGATTVSAGTLQFAKQASLYNSTTASWTNSNIIVKSGGTLALNVGDSASGYFDATALNTLQTNLLGSNASSQGFQSGSSIGLDTTNATGATFTQGNAIVNSTGAGGGAIGLTKLGTGTLILDKANTYTGNTTISGGTLKVDGTGTLGASASYAGNITLSSGTQFDYNSSATQTLTGTVTGSGSTFTVSNGTVKFSGNDRWGTGVTLSISSGATFDYTPANTHRFSSGAMNITGTGTFKSSGAGTSYLANGTSYQAVNMSAGGKFWVSSGTASDYNVKTTNLGDLQLDGILQQPLANDVYFNAFNGASTGQFKFSTTGNGYGLRVGVNNGGGTFAGVISDAHASLNAAFTKVGNGTQILSGANTYRGATNVQNGTLQLGGADNRLSSSTVLTLGNLTTSGKLILGSTSVAGVTNSKSDLTIAGLQTSGSGNANAIVGGNASISTLTINLASGTNTFSGTLGGGGTNENNLALTKSGAGTLTLTNTNIYTGATLVTAGTLLVNGSLGATAITVGATATIGGTGFIDGSIDFDAGSTLNILDINDALSITGNVTFDGFGFSNITGWDYTTASNGTYTLLAGSNISLANVSNVGADNAYDLADGRSAYFQNGSLQVVIVPEPGAALLGSLGLLALLRRRRH